MSQERRGTTPGGQGGRWGRGGWGAMGMPVEKAKDFQGTLKRLLGYFVATEISLAGRACRGNHRHDLQHRWSEDPGVSNHQAL